ncbi:MAG: hypothetical protein AAGG68_04645 [Bacteroidota bacterium]
MKIRLKIFLFSICFLSLSSNAIQAQNTYQISGKSLLELKQEQDFQSDITFSKIQFHSPTFNTDTPVSLTQKIQALSLSETYWEELGFFCKMEIKMEQKARFPVKFRLGTVDYVDRLEGKYR